MSEGSVFEALKLVLNKTQLVKHRVAPVRFGSVTVWGWNGSSGSGFRFRRFLEGGGFCVVQYSLAERTVPVSGFGSWTTVPAVPVLSSVPGKTVPTVPVSGSGSVPGPPWKHYKGFGGKLVSREAQHSDGGAI